MNIIETEINDINILNIDETKLNIANKIIEFVSPLFEKEYVDKVREIKKLSTDIASKKELIGVEKKELEELSKNLNKRKKESLLLGKISKLVYSGLIQDSMRNELVVLLKSFEGMSEERINNYLNESMKIISQRFAKE